MAIRILVFALLAMLPVSCGRGTGKGNIQVRPGKKEMAELNKYLVQKDRERIENYLERKNLKMTESPAGFWYLIKSEGEGDYFIDNDRIVIDYDCSLLDGTRCYSSDELGPKVIILGKSEVEAGLDLGLRMLKPRGEAIFILPPFLAFGLRGDGKKIPSRGIIVYNVQIVN
jgi:FKBP-type peptidyl-prolyl cis-trans isomerase FkpA